MKDLRDFAFSVINMTSELCILLLENYVVVLLRHNILNLEYLIVVLGHCV